MGEVMSEEMQKTLLIADDDPDILELVAFRFEQSGYKVFKAKDGEIALELSAEKSPDLVILDVMMPKFDGYAVAKKLREQESTATVPIILLTARVQESDVERGFDAGVNDYIKKPFSPRELQTRVEALLGQR